MTGNDMNGTSSPLGDGILAVHTLIDETGQKRKPGRLVITGGMFGPQLTLLNGSDENIEKDPNP